MVGGIGEKGFLVKAGIRINIRCQNNLMKKHYAQNHGESRTHYETYKCRWNERREGCRGLVLRVATISDSRSDMLPHFGSKDRHLSTRLRILS